MLNVKPIFFHILMVYSLLTGCANFAYSDSTFLTEEIKQFQLGDLKKLIINRNATPVSLLEFIDVDNKTIDINLDDGNFRVINFWALWCAPCRREMGSLNELKNHIEAENFEVIAVAAGRNNVAKIREFFIEGNLSNLKSLRDPTGKISNSLGVVGLPTTLLIAPNGFEIGRVIGDINWASTESIKLFEFLLEKQKNLGI